MFYIESTKELNLQTREEVTALAAKERELGGTVGEREVKVLHVARIQEAIVSGNVLPFYWANAYVEANGIELRIDRRVDGMHSGMAFIGDDEVKGLTDEQWEQVRYPVTVILTTYKCDTKEDIATLFAQFNPGWSSRNREDIAGAYLANYDDLREKLGRYALPRVTNGLRWYLSKVEKRVVPKGNGDLEIINTNSDVHTFMLFCGNDGLKLSKKNVEMAIPPVIAAMYETVRRGDDGAKAFWQHVSGGSGSITDLESPERKLAEFLENCLDKQAQWERPARFFKNKKAPNDVEIFSTCLRLFKSAQEGMKNVPILVTMKEYDPAAIARVFTTRRAA